MLLLSLLVSEDKLYRPVPDVLEGVLSLEEYQARRAPPSLPSADPPVLVST